MQELVQPGEGELGLCFDASRRQDPTAAGLKALASTLQQRRLADARFAADDQRAADTRQTIDEPIETL
jgi:hypothetical protein